MTVEVLEVINVTSSAAGATATVTTDLVPGDVLIAVTGQYYLFSASPSGLGTWSGVHLSDTSSGLNTGASVYTSTGVTGGGNVTFTSSSSAYSFACVLLVVRGLPTSHLNDFQFIFADSSTTFSVDRLTRKDSICLLVGHAYQAFSAFPGASDPDASNWVLDKNTGTYTGVSVAHYINSEDRQLSTSLMAAGFGTVDSLVSYFNFGGPDESRVSSSDLEVLASGSPYPAREYATYLETVTSSTSTASKVSAQNIEVLAKLDTARDLTNIYIEVPQTSGADAAVHSSYLETMYSLTTVDTVYTSNLEVLASGAPGPAVHTSYTEVISVARQPRVLSAYTEVMAIYIPPAVDAWEGWGVVF